MLLFLYILHMRNALVTAQVEQQTHMNAMDGKKEVKNTYTFRLHDLYSIWNEAIICSKIKNRWNGERKSTISFYLLDKYRPKHERN